MQISSRRCLNLGSNRRCGNAYDKKILNVIVSKLMLFIENIFDKVSVGIRITWSFSTANNPHLHLDTYPSQIGGDFRLLLNLGRLRTWAMSYNLSQAYEYSDFVRKTICEKPDFHHIKRKVDENKLFQSNICKELPSHIFYIPFGTIWITDGKLNFHQVLSGSALLVATLRIPKGAMPSNYVPPNEILNNIYRECLVTSLVFDVP